MTNGRSYVTSSDATQTSFPCTGPGDLGRTNVIRDSISTQSSHPIRSRQYRQPYHLKKEMDRQIGDMLTNGVIKESSSPWTSPVLMVPKKVGTFRFCVDFRGLNELTIKGPFPLPRIDETLEPLGGARYFSSGRHCTVFSTQMNSTYKTNEEKIYRT